MNKLIHQHSLKKRRKTLGSLAILSLLFYAGCAQVPRQSVELSATVGRDIAQVHKAHRELAFILYERIKRDVNKFVDEVYAPFQIGKLLRDDYEDFKRGVPESLFFALETSIKQPNNPDLQKTALGAMAIIVQEVRDDIESYRKKRLEPVLAQEEKVLSAIDRSYNQIQYANSIVTGHLASIVKVHNAQEELLNEIGIEGLSKQIGEKLSSTSNKVADFVEKAKRVEGTLAEMQTKIENMTKALDDMVAGAQEKKED